MLNLPKNQKSEGRDFMEYLQIEIEKHFTIIDKYNNHFNICAFSIGEIIDNIQRTFKNGEFVILEKDDNTGEILNNFTFDNTPL